MIQDTDREAWDNRASSRRRYDEFRQRYRRRELADASDKNDRPQPSAQGEDKHVRRRYFREYLRWTRPFWRAVALLLTLSVLAAAMEMVHPLFMRYIVDDILLSSSDSKADMIRQLNRIGIAFLALVAGGQVLEAIRMYRQKQLNVRLVLTIRRTLYERMLHLPLSSLSDMKTGGIISRLSGDVDTTSGLLQMGVISPGVSALKLLLALTLLFVVNWRLALMAVAVVPGIIFVSFTVVRRIRPIYRAIRDDRAVVDARVGETFSGIRAVRAFGREMLEELFYIGGHHTIIRKQLFAHRREVLVWSTWSVLLTCVSLVIVWFGGYLVIQGRASVGDIMAFQWYTLMILNPIWRLVESFSELQRSLAAMERVFDVLHMDPDKPDRSDAIAAAPSVESFEFRNVSFAYREGEPVVKNFSIQVQGGEVIALVGKSGAGKTTVTDLVARFHDPTEGTILLNGTDIRQLTLSTYRRLLGVVQQEVFLFDGTVRENIQYGRRDATEQQTIDAAVRANAHEFIMQLPEQYDTVIGERGVKLSGGQRQRLSIARAILADPRILILDEATSNLDSESEQLIQESLDDLLRDRTTFVIAHRLSTIKHAHQIIVMEEGRIVEAGTHQELMGRHGVYHDMVQRQHLG